MNREIWDLLSPKTKDIRGYLNELIRLRYNEGYFRRLKEKAERTTLGKYKRITEYYCEICDLIQKMNICMSKENGLTPREQDQLIMGGLSR